MRISFSGVLYILAAICISVAVGMGRQSLSDGLAYFGGFLLIWAMIRSINDTVN
jgi:hypothetical protein